jgi:putative salt-induced outer membrane protein YdiY
MRAKSILWRSLVVVLSVILSVSAAVDSEIILANGDRVSGTIVEEGTDTVVVETVYAGRIKIARSHIKSVNVNRTAGTAPAVPAKPGAAVPAGAPKGAVAVKAAVVDRKPAGFAGHVRRIATGWEGSANIGFSYTSGNSNNITMSTGLRAAKTRPQDGVTIYVRSLWNSNHGSRVNVTTQNAFWGGVRYDRTIDKKIFGFASYDFERDKPKRLDFRSVAGGGIGHRTIRSDHTELEFLVGGAWNRTWQAGADSNTPEGLAGFTFKRKINDRLRFQNSFTLFQNVTDITERRFIFDATLNADVTKKVGFYITLGDRFNNDPLGTAKKNDFLFTTGMKWNFGKKK